MTNKLKFDTGVIRGAYLAGFKYATGDVNPLTWQVPTLVELPCPNCDTLDVLRISEISTVTTNTLATTTMDKQTLDDWIATLRRYQSPVERMKNAIIKSLREMGLHPDMLEKVVYAMSTAQGQMVIEKITLNDMRDIETLAQKFITIYQDVTR